ncbi:DEAD/DEAH box helicase [Dendrosporobacter sp. 1207_IL3150]|uniref:DEAD/DEAH box helicase n=1 Tax=Dendrosporobacter sp. 1207_IL3150 TaxID=3084054 RepID=UPI002FDA0749
MGNYFIKNYNKLRYPKGSDRTMGLRNAQIGAIHAIASFFTIHKNKAAIIVMPTGSGKTSVLMMAPYILQSKKILIVTPSVMVRGQIKEDFEELKTLRKATVFNDQVEKPKVYELKHTYNSEIHEKIDRSDVVIATPQCALTLSESEDMLNKFDLVLIDEAHHSPAKTWQQILINMNNSKHILVTATPYRLDRKEIKGEIIFSYPLSMAYADGIFGEIEYIPIDEAPNKDFLIAKQAERVLIADRELGYEHYLMVRANSKEKAKELEKLYQTETKLLLKRIDSSMTNKVVDLCIKELKDKKLDGIICVDMLGEGFDFPNLKIAAIHSPHKSLANTLQFIGRFARTNAENIGTAKFIAMNDNELLIENTNMYSNDAIWQDIIIDLSEGKTRKEEATKQYFRDFRKGNQQTETIDEEISLHSIRPNCHAKVYKVNGINLTAEFPEECNVSDLIFINENDNTVIGIGKNYSPPRWGTNNNILDIQNILHVVHFQKECNLLFIYSQTKTEIIYEKIADAFSDSYEKIPKYQMNRVLGELSEFEIFNSGMQNRFSESGESYRISAGADVSSAIDPITGKLYSPGHVFCKAQTEDNQITIGFSSGAKIWSSTYFSIQEYIKWCDYNGRKIANSNIKVKTNTNYDYLPMPKRLQAYPDNIFMCDYSANTYSSPPILYHLDNQIDRNILTEIVPNIIEVKKDKIKLLFSFQNLLEEITCDINAKYTSLSSAIMLLDGRGKISLVDYLNEYPLIFRTTDDVTIQDIEYCEGNPKAIIFSSDNIIAIDWNQYGTDIKVEVNDNRYHPTEKSIQSTLKEILEANNDYKYLIYDHGNGEIADFISILEKDHYFEVTLYHVKGMSSALFNSSVNDVYEVSGQAVKSTIWLKTKPGFINKVTSRRRAGYCKFIRGEFEDFRNTLKQNKQLTGKIVIVQPSISKSIPIPEKLQEVLAATKYYISNSGKTKSLEIMGSI